MGVALGNLEDESRGFSEFPSIFAKSIPDDWAVTMSGIADNISRASNHARLAGVAWPDLSRERADDMPSSDISNSFVTDIGEVVGKSKIFTGTPKEIMWKQFSHDFFVCANYLLFVIDATGIFRESIKRRNIKVGDLGKYRHIDDVMHQIETSGGKIKHSVGLIKEGKLSRLRKSGYGIDT